MNRKLLAVLALALLVRVFTFAGYVGQPDEITNVEMVQEILSGSWPRYEDRIVEMVFPTRIGYLGVNAALVGLLGPSDLSYTLYSLLASLGTLVVVFFLGRRWLGERGAVWAALLFAFFPLDVIFASKVSGDPALTFLCALSVLLFFRAQDLPSRGRRARGMFLAGCVAGLAYLHKVTAGYVCVFFAVIGVAHMLRARRVCWRYGALALGFALLFTVEMGFQLAVNQDPLYRWHVFMRQSESPELRASLHAEERLDGWRDDVKRLCWTFPVRSLFSLRLGLYHWFIFPAVAYALLFRRKDLWAPLLWWFLVAALLNLSTWGGGRLPFYARQLYPVVVPGVILLAAAFAALEQWRALEAPGFRRAMRVLLGAAAAISLAGGVLLSVFRGDLIPLLSRVYAANRIKVSEEMVSWFLGFFFRYVIAACFVIACFFAVVWFVARRRERRGGVRWGGTAVAACLAGFLALSSLTFAYLVNRGTPAYGIEKEAFRLLRDLPPGTVYADWYTKKMLDFYLGFRDPDRVKDLREADRAGLRGGYLVYNVFRSDMEKAFRRVEPDYRKDDPFLYAYGELDRVMGDGWPEAGRVRGGQIVIYRIPD